MSVSVRRALWILMGAATLVLLIVCILRRCSWRRAVAESFLRPRKYDHDDSGESVPLARTVDRPSMKTARFSRVDLNPAS